MPLVVLKFYSFRNFKTLKLILFVKNIEMNAWMLFWKPFEKIKEFPFEPFPLFDVVNISTSKTKEKPDRLKYIQLNLTETYK